MITVGLIGAGGIAEPHVAGYLEIADEARLTAVCDIDVANANRRSAEAGGAQIYTDYRQMLRDPSIDAVDICLPHHLHAQAIIASADAGKHILCEKPLCLSLEEADEIRHAVTSNGVTLMCAHNQLYLPVLRRARQILSTGVLGPIVEARTADCFASPMTAETIGWRANRGQAGGGVLIDTGYHPTYMLLHLIGDSPTEVTALFTTHRLTFAEGEDTALLLLRFAGGAMGTVTTSWAYDLPPDSDRFLVIAENGFLSSDGETLRYRVADDDIHEEHLPKTKNLFSVEIAEFVSDIRDGRRPLNTEEEGIDVLKTILAAYRSAGERRTVTP